MKLTLFTFLTSIFFLSINAPLYGQNAVTTTGGNAISESGSVSYTVGQVFFHPVRSSSATVLQGVQQPWEITVISGISDAEGISLHVMAYPNPVVDYLILKVESYKPEGIIYQLFDINGKLLESKAADVPETRIAMASRHPATYILRVFDKHKEIRAFRIVKF